MSHDDMKCPVLGHGNYISWSNTIESILQYRGLWPAILGTAGTPPEIELKARALLRYYTAQWLHPIIHGKTAAQAWAALKTRSTITANARKSALRSQITNAKLQSGESVSEFAGRLESLKLEATELNMTVTDTDLALALLAGLPNKYRTVKTVIETTNVALTLVSILPLLQTVEVGTDKDHDTAFPASSSSSARGGGNGGRRGGPQYGRGNGGSGHGGQHSGPKGPCFYCGKDNHIKADCRSFARDKQEGKLHPDKYSRSGSRNKGSDNAPRRNFAMVAANTTSTTTANTINPNSTGSSLSLALMTRSGAMPTNGWFIDSGASSYMTYDPDDFIDYTPSDTHPVYLGDGRRVMATGMGTAILRTMFHGQLRVIKLADTLLVPELTVKLLSVKRLVLAGASVKFSTNGAYIIRSSTVIAHGEPDSLNDESLYIVRTVPPDYANVASVPPKGELWHKRFGHLGYDNMAKLVTKDMVTGIDVPASSFTEAKSNVCDSCILGKQHRHPFPTSTSESANLLDLVHMDLQGPIYVTSVGGMRYIATFLDDKSKFSIVTPLPSKDEVAPAVIKVLTYLENQAGRTIKAVRTDRGTEYVNETCGSWFASKGIHHEKTAPYSPQQNGAAERLNRTLMEKVNTMLIESSLPLNTWAEAVNTANYLRNRSPVSGQDKTPFELFFNIKPDVSHLRVFGCVAYAHVPKQLRRKLQPTALRGIFVGYQPDSKAYRILLDGTKKVVISRDVTFNESAFQHDAPPDNDGYRCPLIDEPSPPPTAPPAPEPAAPVPAPTPPTPHAATNQGPASPTHTTAAVGPAPLPFLTPTNPAAPTDNEEAGRAARARRPPQGIFSSTWNSTNNGSRALLAAATAPPSTYEEAIARDDADMWRAAMNEEISSLLANNTYTLEPLPAGFKALPCKWVFTIKRDADGNIKRYKARLVVKGFMQREGIDYTEVFAPVSKHATLRVLLSSVANDNLVLKQLDVKTAFLHGELEETIYMKQPPGYEEGVRGIACRLHKSLYGLKQAPRAWFNKLKSELLDMGFNPSNADPSLYVRHDKHGPIYVLVYVDDILVAGYDDDEVDSAINLLKKLFDCRELDADFFLGMDIIRDNTNGNLKICQRRLIAELIEKHSLQDCKPKSTPLSPSIKLSRDGEPLDPVKYGYRELVGSLLYISVCTRPDITHAVGMLTRAMSAPTVTHWQAAKGVVRYLAGTPDYGITFGAGPSGLVGYSDSDYAGDIDTRRSTTGYVFLLHGGAISWSSHLQKTVAASTTEAEYMAAAASTKEALWLRNLLSDFGVNTTPVMIYGDNQATIHLLKNANAAARSKHIDVMHHFARERFLRNEVNFEYIATHLMLADCMTKALPEPKFLFCRNGMGVN